MPYSLHHHRYPTRTRSKTAASACPRESPWEAFRGQGSLFRRPLPGGRRRWLLAGQHTGQTGERHLRAQDSDPALAGVVLTLLALSGCGASSSSSSSTTTAATTTPAKAAAFIAPLKSFSTVASTVPANGDIIPTASCSCPTSIGKLKAGNLLVSNFNAKESAPQNGQGTGTSIVQVSPTGKLTPFATINANGLPGPCPGGVGSDDRPEHPPRRLRGGRQPADHERQVCDRQVRVHDRPRQRRQGDQDHREKEHPGSVGLDRQERRLQDDAVRQQRVERRCREGQETDQQLHGAAHRPRIGRRARNRRSRANSSSTKGSRG